MTVLHCSQKLLKRMRQPAKLPTPPPGDNPLGPWCADIDFIDRQPFAVLMNAATGTVLVLPARAADLRQLHVTAAQQLAGLFTVLDIGSAQAKVELDALQTPFTLTANGNRSWVASMNQRKYEAWVQFAYDHITAFDVARRMLKTPFSRKDLGGDFHFAADLLRQHLRPSARILHFTARADKP